MSDRTAKRAREIYLELSTLDESAVNAELERIAGDDPELREAVISLIDAEARADGAGFMSSPTASTTAMSATITETAGTVIGRYKLLQLIGEGGFGSVFLAEQARPVRRRVALKIIKLGMDTKQVIARFEAERQALAMMDHPHIARVYDAGATDTGRPYFAMEYVVGDAITKFADAHKLSITERLALFTQVCSAVQHAHTKGVIHRDLKPANVLVSMVDGKPYAKVIDFGIAKATSSPLTDKTLFTEHRQLIGTPEYMSPEQAEGSPDIDTRTDVYALGVLLYELLTGVTPFDAKRLLSAGFGEMQRIIKEEDPPAPSVRLTRNLESLAQTAMARQVEPTKLSTAMRGELDWIVMKALDKDRGRRYESAAQLALDIANHLAGEAVVAAPPSRGYRVRKFVRRNRGAVIATTAVFCVFTVGLISTTAALRVAQYNANAANHNAELVTAARDELQRTNAKLEAQAEQARSGVGEMLGILSEGVAGRLVDSIDPETGESVFEQNPLGATVGMGLDLARSLKEERDKLQQQAMIARNAMDRISEIVGCEDCGPDEAKVIGQVFFSAWKETEEARPFLDAPEEELRMRALAAFAELQARNLVAESDRSSRIARAVTMLGDVQSEYVANRAAEDYDGNLAVSDQSRLAMLLDSLDHGLLIDSPDADFSIRSALISLMEVSMRSDAMSFCQKTLQEAEQLFGPEHPITIRILTKLVSMHDQSYEIESEERLAEARIWYEQLRQRVHAVRGDLPEFNTRQWATKLIDFSSQYNDSSWTASMVLGEPDAFSYTDHRGAWTPKYENRKLEYVTVGFERPVFATGVMVRQVLNNGFVRLIEVVDLGGELHPVWAGEDTSERGIPYDFVARFQRTPFAVRGVRVTIDGSHTTSYEEVDAIELLGFLACSADIEADPDARAIARSNRDQALRRVNPIVMEAIASAPTLQEARQRLLTSPDLATTEQNAAALAFTRTSLELQDQALQAGEQIAARFITLDRSIAELDRTESLSPIMRDEIRKALETLALNSIYTINERIWKAVHVPGASAETLAIALEEALALTEAYHESPNYRFSLGVTQYRLGQYENALATLTESRRLFGERALTLNHLFLAMTYARLSMNQEALDIYLNWDDDLRSTDPNTENGRIYAEMLVVLSPILKDAGIDPANHISPR